MKTTGRFAILTVASLLVACGGSSGNGTNGSNSGGSGTVNLSATIVQNTVCGTEVSATTAELVVYDADWNIRSRHTPDPTGRITATVPSSNAVNISFIGIDGAGSDRYIDVVTYAEHPVGDLGVYVVPGNATQGCECVQTDIIVSSELGSLDYNIQLAGYNGSGFKMNRLDSNTLLYNDVNVCRETGGDWPTLYAAANNDFSAVAGSLTNYDPNQQLTIVVDQSPNMWSALVDQQASSVSAVHHLPNDQLIVGLQQPYLEMPLFEQFSDVEVVSLRGSETSIQYVDDLSIRLGRSQRHSSTLPLNEMLEITLPDSSAQQHLLAMLQKMLETEETNYDLTAVTDFDTLYLDIFTFLSDGSFYNQSFYGPGKGTLPKEALPADYGVDTLLDSSKLDLLLAMVRYGSQQSYQQFQASRVSASKNPLNQSLIGDRSQYNQVYVQISQ